MKTAAAALLGFVLTGCAPAAGALHARAPAPPVSQWENGSDDDLEVTAPEEVEHVAGAPGAETPPTEAQQAGDREPPFGGLEPAVVHRARIEMARAALVEENENKERVDLAEELQRELAALQATSQSSKSRVKHGGPAKKQP